LWSLLLFVVNFPSFSIAKGLLSWGVREGQEGGMPPPVLGYAFAVEYSYRYSQTLYHNHDTQSSEYQLVVYGDEGYLGVVVGVVGAVTLGVNVSIKHHDELTLECKFALFICVLLRAFAFYHFCPAHSSQAYIIVQGVIGQLGLVHCSPLIVLEGLRLCGTWCD
jgi:hypothetical protein